MTTRRSGKGKLDGKEDDLLRDLKRTTLSLEKLGERYRVSRQAIHQFSKKNGVKRPVNPKGHEMKNCRLCQKLIRISKKRHSEFISIPTIIEETGRSRPECSHHLRMLRNEGLVGQRFGKLRSKRLEKAYVIYFKERLPTRQIGRMAGLKNFHAIIRQHRELGYNVPASLYDGRRGRRLNKGGVR